ncbi:hypothetical protein A4A49_59272, partial [Nicotiana attenuata]
TTQQYTQITQSSRQATQQCTVTTQSSQQETQQQCDISYSSQQATQSSQLPTQQACDVSQQPSQKRTKYTPRRLIDSDFGTEPDPVLRPKVVSGIMTRLQVTNKQQNTGIRIINFTGDHTGSSQPTNFPYSPTRATWKGKQAMTRTQLLGVKERKIRKHQTRKGKGK